MNVLDSSGWIEFLSGGVLAATFLPIVEDKQRLIVPSIVLYEVQKWTLLEKGEFGVRTAMGLLLKGSVILLDPILAGDAARISITHKLAMADAIIYATALAHAAEVWTTDAHFKDLPNVRYFDKREPQ